MFQPDWTVKLICEGQNKICSMENKDIWNTYMQKKISLQLHLKLFIRKPKWTEMFIIPSIVFNNCKERKTVPGKIAGKFVDMNCRGTWYTR